MTLRLKMVLGIAAVVLVVVVAYAAVMLKIQADHLRDVGRREAELIAGVTERAVVRTMTEGKRDLQAILEEIGTLPPGVGIRIANADGSVFRSSRWNLAERTVEVSRAIPNRAACHACHGRDRTTLGSIAVRLFVPQVDARLAEQWRGIALPAVTALVVAGGLIGVYFTLVVGRRIDALSDGMRRVERGDLAASVPEDDRDELGRLGKSFNLMVARLADAQHRLEDRHAAEIRRAEHLAALGKLAAGVAHEINNPLAGMQSCVRTLQRGPRDERQRAQYLELLRDGLGRIGRIVGQLLNFARESPPQLVPADVSAVVGRSLALVEHEMAARNVCCSVSPGVGVPAVLADLRQLEQVFLNILMNALEAMPHGGTMAVATELTRRGAERFVEVRVTDSGAGIAPEHVPRVFDPFFTTREVGKGTGLGLSVSYGIVKAHGGLIDVESEVGRGSTFTVALPAGE
ncbi:MAG: HAMP domain-containing protein [Candidatus Rokubacteria bacterium]|nr:HAMP domain-containing protein [Candidatus Rokubacteria bacterium]